MSWEKAKHGRESLNLGHSRGKRHSTHIIEAHTGRLAPPSRRCVLERSACEHTSTQLAKPTPTNARERSSEQRDSGQRSNGKRHHERKLLPTGRALIDKELVVNGIMANGIVVNCVMGQRIMGQRIIGQRIMGQRLRGQRGIIIGAVKQHLSASLPHITARQFRSSYQATNKPTHAMGS